MMKVVHTLRDQVDASVIAHALDEAGIKHVIRTFADSAYDGIFILQKGYGEVLVDESDASRAKEIVEAVIRSEEL